MASHSADYVGRYVTNAGAARRVGLRVKATEDGSLVASTDDGETEFLLEGDLEDEFRSLEGEAVFTFVREAGEVVSLSHTSGGRVTVLGRVPDGGGGGGSKVPPLPVTRTALGMSDGMDDELGGGGVRSRAGGGGVEDGADDWPVLSGQRPRRSRRSVGGSSRRDAPEDESTDEFDDEDENNVAVVDSGGGGDPLGLGADDLDDMDDDMDDDPDNLLVASLGTSPPPPAVTLPGGPPPSSPTRQPARPQALRPLPLAATADSAAALLAAAAGPAVPAAAPEEPAEPAAAPDLPTAAEEAAEAERRNRESVLPSFARAVARVVGARGDGAEVARGLAEIEALDERTQADGWLLAATTLPDRAAIEAVRVAGALAAGLPSAFNALRAFLSALREARRLKVLEEGSWLALHALGGGEESSAPPDQARMLRRALAAEEVLLGYQHSPDLFLAFLPALGRMLDEAEAAGAGQAAGRVAGLLATLVFLFPAYYEAYKPVLPRVAAHALPGRTDMQAAIRERQWAGCDSGGAAVTDADAGDAGAAGGAPALASWVEGHYTSGRGDMCWRLAACVEGRRVGGSFAAGGGNSEVGGAGPARGDRVVVRVGGVGAYYRGTVEAVFFSRCLVSHPSGRVWAFSDETLPHRLPAVGSLAPGDRVLARSAAAPAAGPYRAGTVTGRSGDRVLVRLDGGAFAEPFDELSHVLALPPATPPRVRGPLDGGAIDAVLRVDATGSLRISGTWQPVSLRHPGLLDARVSDRGDAFAGRSSHGDCEALHRAWIGVLDRPADALEFSGAAATGEPRRPLGLAPIVAPGAHLFAPGSSGAVCVAGYSPLTVQCAVLLPEGGGGGGRHVLVAKRSATDTELELGVVDGRPYFQDPGEAARERLPRGRWVWLAAARSEAGAVELYVDGVLAHRSDIVAPAAACPAAPLTFGGTGRHGGPLATPLGGPIADVRLWSRRLDAGELAASPPPRPGGREPGLLGYWPLVSVHGVAADLGPLGLHALPLRLTAAAAAAAASVSPAVAAAAIVSGGGGTAPPSPGVGPRGTWAELPAGGGPHSSAGHFTSAWGGLLLAGAAAPVPAPDGGRAVSLGPAGGGGGGAAAWMERRVRVLSGFASAATLARRSPADLVGVTLVLQGGPAWELAPLPSTPRRLAVRVGVSFGPAGVVVEATRVGATGQVRQLGLFAFVQQGGAAAAGWAAGGDAELHVSYSTGEAPCLRVSVRGHCVCRVPVDLREALGLAADPAGAAWIGLQSGGSLHLAKVAGAGRDPGAFQLAALSRWTFGPAADAPAADARAAAAAVAGPPTLPLGGLAGALRSVAALAAELERMLHPASFEPSWWRAREGWQARLASAGTLREAAAAQEDLARGLRLARLKPDERTRLYKRLREAGSVSDLATGLTRLSMAVPESGFEAAWKDGDMPQAFAAAVEHVRAAARAEAYHTTALRMSARLGAHAYSPAMCVAALEDKSGAAKEAERLLFGPRGAAMRAAMRSQRFELASRRLWREGGGSAQSRASPADAFPDALRRAALGDGAPVAGSLWQTSAGPVRLQDRGAFVGHEAASRYVSRGGSVHGLMSRDPRGRWLFEGAWRQSDVARGQVCRLAFAADGASWEGSWSTHDKSGKWNGRRVSNHLQRAATGYTGLKNLGNTCYQNSYLQCLFNTSAWRDRFLSALIEPGSGAAGAAGAKPDAEREKALAVAVQVQQLFATLKLSRRPHVNQEPLKSILGEPFNGNRQQDSSSYGQYMLDTLQSALKGTPLASLNRSVFGGELRNVTRCQSCGFESSTDEEFADLGVSFPKAYGPITHVAVVGGPSVHVAPPPGYDRVSGNLNRGRKGAPSAYVCVRRDPLSPPITDLFVVYGTPDARLPVPEDFEMIPENVNEGGVKMGSRVHLCVRRSPAGAPITRLEVVYGQDPNPNGFDRLDLDLNYQSGGKPTFLCYFSGTPITDLVVLAGSLHAVKRQLADGYKLLGGNVNLASSDELARTGAAGAVAGEDLAAALVAAGPRPPGLDALGKVQLQPEGLPWSSDEEEEDDDGDDDDDDDDDDDTGDGGGSGSSTSGLSSDSDSDGGTAAPRRRARLRPGSRVERAAKARAEAEQAAAAAAEEAAWVDERPELPPGVDMPTRDVHLAFTGGGDRSRPPLTGIRVVVSAKEPAPASEREQVLPLGGGKYLVCSRGEGAPLTSVSVYRAPLLPPQYGGYESVDLWVEPRAPPSLYDRRWFLATGAKLEFKKRHDRAEFEAVVVRGRVTGGSAEGTLEGIVFPEYAQNRPNGLQLVLRALLTVKGKEKETQPVRLVFDDMDCSGFKGHRRVGDASPRWSGARSGVERREPPPVVDVVVIDTARGETRPAGYEEVRTPAGRRPSVGAGMVICVRRRGAAGCEAPEPELPVTEVGVLWPAIGEQCPTTGQWETIRTTPAGHSAALPGPMQNTVLLCFRRGADARAVGGLRVVRRADDGAGGYTPIETSVTVSLEANITDDSFLAVLTTAADAVPAPPADAAAAADASNKSKGKADEEEKKKKRRRRRRKEKKKRLHKCHGVFSSNCGMLDLRVERKVRARYVRAAHNNSYEDYFIDGLLVARARGDPRGPGWRLYGSFTLDKERSAGHTTLEFDRHMTEFRGEYICGKQRGEWHGLKDCYARLGWARDTRSLWRNGAEVFSSAAGGNDLGSMVRETFCPELLTGSNRITCGGCREKRDVLRWPCLRRAPSHLVASVKRFSFDYATYKSKKIMEQLYFERTLSLPVPPAHMRRAVFGDGTEAAAAAEDIDGNLYGLYGIVIHRGSRLDDGHYLAYARDSSCDLSLDDDDDNGPWRRFDDDKIEPSSWAELTEQLRRSRDETAYLLYYRRIDRKGGGGGDRGGAASDTEPPGLGREASSSSVSSAFHLRDGAVEAGASFSMAPRLPPAVVKDNAEFLFRDMAEASSAHYLEALHAAVRERAGFTGPFVPSDAPLEPLGPVPRAHASAGAAAELPQGCSPFEVVECVHCGLMLSASACDAHFCPGADGEPSCRNRMWRSLGGSGGGSGGGDGGGDDGGEEKKEEEGEEEDEGRASDGGSKHVVEI